MDAKWFNINRNQDFLFVVGDIRITQYFDMFNIDTQLCED